MMPSQTGTLGQAALVTIRRLLAGYAIGIVLGLPLGLLTARFKLLEDTVGVNPNDEQTETDIIDPASFSGLEIRRIFEQKKTHDHREDPD
jgi:hypothetical protein